MKAAGLIIALGILVTGADMACSRIQMTPSIERNDYGKGKKVEELDVQIGNKKKKVRTSVEVSERQYLRRRYRNYSQGSSGKWTG